MAVAQEYFSKEDVIKNKIYNNVEDLKRRIASWRLKNDLIVFTNGCFDILHTGHVTYIAKAADYGNKLIVGINSDASVKRLEKGDDRPVNDENSRALIVASLHHVDAVFIFDEDTPLELITGLKPDILVKGGDYDENETDPDSKKYIVGSDLVKSYNGKVVTVPTVEGFSTTGIIDKLKK